MKMDFRGKHIDDLARLAVQSNLLDEYRVAEDVVELFCDEHSFRLSRPESSVFLIGMLTADSRRERLNGDLTRQKSDDAAVIWDDRDEHGPRAARIEEPPRFRTAILEQLVADAERKGVIRGYSLDVPNDSVRIYFDTSTRDMTVGQATRFLRGALGAPDQNGEKPMINKRGRERPRQLAVPQQYADGHGGVWLL